MAFSLTQNVRDLLHADDLLSVNLHDGLVGAIVGKRRRPIVFELARERQHRWIANGSINKVEALDKAMKHLGLFEAHNAQAAAPKMIEVRVVPSPTRQIEGAVDVQPVLTLAGNFRPNPVAS